MNSRARNDISAKYQSGALGQYRPQDLITKESCLSRMMLMSGIGFVAGLVFPQFLKVIGVRF